MLRDRGGQRRPDRSHGALGEQRRRCGNQRCEQQYGEFSSGMHQKSSFKSTNFPRKQFGYRLLTMRRPSDTDVQPPGPISIRTLAAAKPSSVTWRISRSVRCRPGFARCRPPTSSAVSGSAKAARSTERGNAPLSRCSTAPLHFLRCARSCRRCPARRGSRRGTTLVDLGCGTGAAGAAWATACAQPPRVAGIDRHPWALGEAARTYRAFGLTRANGEGRHRVGRAPKGPASILAAFALNELADASRDSAHGAPARTRRRRRSPADGRANRRVRGALVGPVARIDRADGRTRRRVAIPDRVAGRLSRSSIARRSSIIAS